MNGWRRVIEERRGWWVSRVCMDEGREGGMEG